MPMNNRLMVPRASGFNPRSIAGLAAWFDAADASSVTISTGVSQWNDKSGNGRNATQGTGNNQPAYTIAGQNGKNILTFDGTNDFLSTAGFTLSQPHTDFIVFRYNSGFGTVVDGFNPNRAALARSVGLLWQMTTSTTLNSGSAIADTNWHALGLVFNTTSSEMFADGVSVATGNAGTANLSTGYILGCFNGTGAFFNGSIAEVLLYSGVLSSSRIATVNAYLKAKWGTP